MAAYNCRIATRITRAADNRLRLAAVTSRRSLSAVLTDAIEMALPTAEELAGQLRDDPEAEGSAA
jgi:hypothetical protein